MSLFDVECQNLIGNFGLRHQKRHDGLGPQFTQRREAMITVRCPKFAVGRDRDQRIQKALRLVHRTRELAHVRIAHVALEGCRTDFFDRQRDEQ